MFARGDFSTPPTPSPSLLENRKLGLLLLLLGIALCLALSFSLDASVFIPFNQTHAATQTYQAQHPPTSTSRFPPTPVPLRTNDPHIQSASLP